MNNQLLQAFQSNFECAVCMRLFDTPITIPCGHTFCKQCIIICVNKNPRCPTCRFTITQEISRLKENLLIKSAVHDLNLLGGQEKKEQIIEEVQSTFIYILTNNVVTPHSYQRIELDRQQFKKRRLNDQTVLQIFKNITKFVIVPNNNQQIGFLATLQLVQIVDGKLKAQILPEASVDIQTISETEFTAGDENLIKYTLPVATVKLQEEDYIDLNDKDIANQVTILVQQIRGTLNPFITQLHNSQTQIELEKFLAQSGLLMYLSMEMEKDWKSLKRFSYLLPSLLNIPLTQKQLIMQQHNCIQRLMMINKNLKRFQNTTNPLTVFVFQTRKNYTLELVILMIVILFGLWYRI